MRPFRIGDAEVAKELHVVALIQRLDPQVRCPRQTLRREIVVQEEPLGTAPGSSKLLRGCLDPDLLQVPGNNQRRLLDGPDQRVTRVQRDCIKPVLPSHITLPIVPLKARKLLAVAHGAPAAVVVVWTRYRLLLTFLSVLKIPDDVPIANRERPDLDEPSHTP